jgi:hypothetical protein
VVGARGFEPPTSRSRTVRSTKLSHAPMLCAIQTHQVYRPAATLTRGLCCLVAWGSQGLKALGFTGSLL